MQKVLEHIPAVYPLYFIYGAVFFYLGIAIAVKEKKTSDLRLAGSLWLLSAFGFTHGAHEWFVLYPLLVGEFLTIHDIFVVKAATVIMVALSFFFLLQFGIRLLRSVPIGRTRLVKTAPILLGTIYMIYLSVYGFRPELRFLRHAETVARLLFGFSGGMATACGLIISAREVRFISPDVYRNLLRAGISFAAYGVFAGLFSSHSALPFLNVPVEAVRGVSAVFIAYFIIRALKIFTIETKRKTELQMQRIIQSEKLTSVGQLAAGIAHEINNPLANASLSIQTLKGKISENKAGDGELEEKINAIERNIDRAAAIARELLQFSRCRESDSMPVDLNSVIESALTLMHYKMKGCLVRKDLAALPPVQGDPVKLEQVIINVLSNACEAMPGGGEIAIHTTRKRDWVRVVISDEGIGLREEHLLRVFDPFFTTKQVGAGTGLGLSICYGIVRQHGGTIEVKNRQRKGVVVTISLPMGRENEKNPDR